MAVDIADVMAECRNHFQDEVTPYIEGDFTLVSGVLTPYSGIADGDYIAITGSRLNDGVYLPTVTSEGVTVLGVDDESFTGKIWILHPPRKFVSLVTEIAAYAATHVPSAIVSESFGNYSGSKAVDVNGMPLGWQAVYAAQLHPYRRMFKVVPL